MESIFVSVVLTASCNLRCTYCINDSGTDLILANSNILEWESAEEIIKCLENISQVRNINTIKFFGGEPMLRDELMMEVILNKHRYSKTGDLNFAFTTNAYEPFSPDVLQVLMDNRTIINISLDGPENINNAARIPVDKGNCFQAVLKNINLLKQHQYPFALVGVLDERLIEYETTIGDIAQFMATINPIYKLEPAYNLNGSVAKAEEDISILLSQADTLIGDVFHGIASLDADQFIFENNVLRTMYNLVTNYQKEHVCSAGNMLAIFPNKNAYCCYNLIADDYFIADDIANMDPNELGSILKAKQKHLKLENFPQEYRDVEFFGDYCPKENNFQSFAYLYRKNMVKSVKGELEKITPGSPEHFALISYLKLGFNHEYFWNKTYA